LFLSAAFVVRAPALLLGSLRVGRHAALRTRPGASCTSSSRCRPE
jgi:hypothetical protein